VVPDGKKLAWEVKPKTRLPGKSTSSNGLRQGEPPHHRNASEFSNGGFVWSQTASKSPTRSTTPLGKTPTSLCACGNAKSVKVTEQLASSTTPLTTSHRRKALLITSDAANRLLQRRPARYRHQENRLAHPRQMEIDGRHFTPTAGPSCGKPTSTATPTSTSTPNHSKNAFLPLPNRRELPRRAATASLTMAPHALLHTAPSAE